MGTRQVYFTGPRRIEVREDPVPDPGPGELRVETELSAVSPGTELLVYRDEVAGDRPSTLATLPESLSYPTTYGYAAVGTVTDAGEGVDPSWIGRRVFAFHPHAGEFVAPVETVVPVPEGVGSTGAAFLANAETAVNLLLDGAPLIGERVAVFGQGVVGLLTTALLARCPVSTLVTADRHERRRDFSESLGADASVDPGEGDVAAMLSELGGAGPAGSDDRQEGGIDDRRKTVGEERGDEENGDLADLTYELSGNPAALDAAIDATGYDGRVVVGSWYGTKTAELDLDGRFHRSRIELESSQVSTIDPSLRGRWSKDRRLSEAWRWLAELDVEPLVTHRIPVEDAAGAYELLDRHPEAAVQVLLTY